MEASRSRMEKFENVLAVGMVGFFVYTVLVWQGILGDGSAWRPAQMALLAGAMALQGAAPVVGRRWRQLQWVLVGVSVALLWIAIRPR